MKKIISLFLLCSAFLSAEAQRTLSLDSCRALALRNNKQINVSKLKQDMAMNIRKAAKTKYLPKVDAAGGYQYFRDQLNYFHEEFSFKSSYPSSFICEAVLETFYR